MNKLSGHDPKSIRRLGAGLRRETETEPSPWRTSREAEVEPDTSKRVQCLLDSSGYRQADRDPEFLRRPEMCGVRLQLDYWKTAELLLRHRIEHTVVMYGSTRIPEPSAARRKL